VRDRHKNGSELFVMADEIHIQLTIHIQRA